LLLTWLCNDKQIYVIAHNEGDIIVITLVLGSTSDECNNNDII